MKDFDSLSNSYITKSVGNDNRFTKYISSTLNVFEIKLVDDQFFYILEFSARDI